MIMQSEGKLAEGLYAIVMPSCGASTGKTMKNRAPFCRSRGPIWSTSRPR